MTGLEKILKHIEEDALAAADQSLTKAKSQAGEIMANARAEGEKKCTDIAEHSKLEVQSALSRAESAANLQEKKLILNAKQEIISEVINRAKESIIILPDKEYFDIIIKMVRKYALAQTGQIMFSSSDNKRLPEQFNEKLKASLAGKDGAVLTAAGDTVNIDGGFVLVYGDIEINCSFDALFAAAKETLQDKVCEVLFE
ncbi:MAG: V-type ATP synthase subunit E [Anaerocolumna sp.]